MNNTKLSILITLFACTGQGKNHYSLISINKIIELLAKRHETHVKRRWVFQCLQDIIETGYLSRRQRYKHQADGTIQQLSSITAISLKGAKLLVAKRVSGAFLLLKRILSWMKNKDKRFPTEPEITQTRLDKIDPSELRRLENLVFSVLKSA